MGSRGSWYGILALALATGMVQGCGGKDRPIKTIGVVTLDGAPVEGASVTFTPVAENGKPATSLTDTDGVFRLSTQREDGALRGEYKVVVVKYENTKKGRAGSKSALPAIYSKAATTPLSCTVPHEGQVLLQLDSRAKR